MRAVRWDTSAAEVGTPQRRTRPPGHRHDSNKSPSVLLPRHASCAMRPVALRDTSTSDADHRLRTCHNASSRWCSVSIAMPLFLLLLRTRMGAVRASSPPRHSPGSERAAHICTYARDEHYVAATRGHARLSACPAPSRTMSRLPLFHFLLMSTRPPLTPPHRAAPRRLTCPRCSS